MRAKATSIWVLTFTLGAAMSVTAASEQFEPGLVTAMDRIGGTLLGTAAFDAVLTDPPDPVQPQRLRIDLNLAQTHPVEVVLITSPGEADPPEPVPAFFRMTVGGPDGLKFEFDPTVGEIIPCILPPADLSTLPLAPADSGNPTPSLRAGLVNALGEVGGNLLGAGKFDAVIVDPPEPVQPQRLRLFVSGKSPVEIVLFTSPGAANPPDPVRAIFHMVLGGDEVELQLGDASTEPVHIEHVDLSSTDPPDPVRR